MVTRTINGKAVSRTGFEDIYPFESRFMTVNGHRMHYVDEGAGPVVLMVHGNPTWSFYYRNLIKGLCPKFRTIVPDHVGCGFSDKPPHSPGPDLKPGTYDYTLGSRVRDLDDFVNGLNLSKDRKINLIVHDWGGMIGLAWALDHLSRVDKLVITNTSGFFLPEGKAFPWMLWIIKYLTWLAVPAVLGLNIFSLTAAFVGTKTRLPQKVRQGLTAPYNSWKNRIATLKFVQDIPVSPKDRSGVIVDHVDKTLHRLDPEKLLFLWGARDFVFDLHFFNEFKRRFPTAQSHVFEDAGHYLFEDKPEQILALIDKFFKGAKG